MPYPLTFAPIFQERIWGGRNLESLYGKALPPDKIIGESWEISDRPEAPSIVTNGPWQGRPLSWLMQEHPEAVMGRAQSLQGRFPLLVKLLDARENLSLQVHPPAHLAAGMGGDPKTEMWYIAAADDGAKLYAGLRRGSTKEEFAAKTANGTVAECFHVLPVKTGDSLFLPSGRVHALGKGLVIFEIQQNSDTTYRVFDWNRVDASGKPRQLHVEESLKSIDFNDFEPPLTPHTAREIRPGIRMRALVRHALFNVDLLQIEAGRRHVEAIMEPRVVGVVTGEVTIAHAEYPVILGAGQFSLVPAGVGQLILETTSPASVLVAAPG